MITIDELKAIWYEIGDRPSFSSNGYRIYLELLLNGSATQSQLCKNREWKKTSVSSAMAKLYDNQFVSCKLNNRKIEYYVNKDILDIDYTRKFPETVDLETFKKLWKIVSDMNQMSANLFRVYIDVLLYGETTPKALWETRSWKITGVSESFRKLYSLGLLNCKEINGKRIYSAKLDFKDEEA